MIIAIYEFAVLVAIGQDKHRLIAHDFFKLLNVRNKAVGKSAFLARFPGGPLVYNITMLNETVFHAEP